ncbi:MAG: putative dsRNA-binding protein, partial [Prevotellaceae bacterium]|nr:putative dsRNA-binding protein [Prevotellaceae bacterium]
LDKMSRKEVNFKSKLIEWSQKTRVQLSFELVEQLLDKDYNPVFHTEVLIEGLSAGKGTGYSKKESQQNAARIALRKIKDDAVFKEALDAAICRQRAEADATEAVASGQELPGEDALKQEPLETDASGQDLPEADTHALPLDDQVVVGGD